jgi:hypothetical protein
MTTHRSIYDFNFIPTIMYIRPDGSIVGDTIPGPSDTILNPFDDMHRVDWAGE